MSRQKNIEVINSDTGYKIEAMVDEIMHILHCIYANNSIDYVNSQFSKIVGSSLNLYKYSSLDENDNTVYNIEEIFNRFESRLYRYYHTTAYPRAQGLKSFNFDDYTFNFLEDNNWMDKANKDVDAAKLSEKEQEAIMKQWAYSQGGNE